MPYLGDRKAAGHRDVTWSNSANSNELDMREASALSLYLDADFAGTSLTVQSWHGSTIGWKDVYIDGAVLSLIVTADVRNVLTPELFNVLGTVRFVSSATETATGRLYLVV